MTDSPEFRRRIRALVEPTLERLGYDLVAIEWVMDARGPILRLSIDKRGGITAEDCARGSEHVSQILDEADPISSSYRLEVSSPGIDRPIQRVSDFQRFVGYRAKVRLVEGYPRRRFTGKLLSVDGGTVRIETDGKEYDFPAEAVERAHLVLDLDEYERLADLDGRADDTAGPEDGSEENEDDQQ